MEPKADSPRPSGRDVIFKGQEIFVRSVIRREGGPLVFTFAARRRGRAHRDGFGEKLFRSRGINAVHFFNASNHWWQTPEMLPAIAAANALRDTAAPSRVLTYGYSMGGFGALAFASRLRADTVIAMSPQATLFRPDLPYDPTWLEDIGDKPELYRVDADSMAGCNVIVGYDPLFGIDVAHVGAIAALHPITPIRMPLAGHRTPSYLRESDLLPQVITSLVTGDAGWQQHRRDIRAARMQSTIYLSGLLRRRPQTSPELRVRLETLMLGRVGGEGGHVDRRTGERWLDQSCRRLMRSGNTDEALERAQQFVDSFPKSKHAGYLLALLQFQADQHLDAQATLAPLLEDQPRFIRLLLLKALVLLATGKTAAAEELIRDCLAHQTAPNWRPGSPRDWRDAAARIVGSALSEAAQCAVVAQAESLSPRDRGVAALKQRLGGKPAPLAGIGRTVMGWLRARLSG